MAELRHQADGPAHEHLITEGLDDELLRQLGGLLTEEISLPGAGGRGAREHLRRARLSFEVGLLDRAESEARAALALSPGHEDALGLIAALCHRRGDLSAAIETWRELSARVTEEPSALRHLGQLVEASLRDEGARARTLHEGEATPAGLPDLEHAFRLAFGGNLQAALRVLDRASSRLRTSDPYLFKLAALERAFLLERAQDVRGAIATLERLADEPGLASDVERLLCLSMLYEREGTPERIRRALRAVRHAYLVTRRPTLLRRIARLLDKLGHAHFAEKFEARYLELFERRMHAVSLREAATALSTAYVPRERLARLPFGHRAMMHLAERHLQRERPLHRRRAAVLALAAGDAARALALFGDLEREGHATATDLFYLADALELSGNGEAARRMRRRAASARATLDGAELTALLGGEEGADEDAVGVLDTPERLAAAAIALRVHAKAHPCEPSPLFALARIERARGREAEARALADHAQALVRSRHAPRPFVLAAAALRCGGEVRGLMHELWVDSRRVAHDHGGGLEPADVLGSVADELRARTVAIFYAVRAFARARYPHRVIADLDDRRFSLRITKDDERSSGDSAGLPIAVAFLSAILGLSVPDDVAFTGAVVCDAHDVITLGRIGDVEAKIEGAHERRLRRIVLPAANREDVAHAERVPRRIAEGMVVFARTLEDVCAAVFPSLG
ncbi:S16 family serine protease [Polyangium aurulentum]|uniref:S16 family serine protease n=1 Tax=Polyangium aurulentum TaxID=2567896 RepID=UPI0010AE317E|nr:S16 family serine protease [Polyangium aurulentum]UQA54765.1 hypothetical protein E8A73_025690 [Polyangium aurulentum]